MYKSIKMRSDIKYINKLVLLIAANILMISCSQLSNTFVSKTYNQDAIYIAPVDNLRTEYQNDEKNTTGIKGSSNFRNDGNEVQDIQFEENIQVPDQQPTSGSSVNTADPINTLNSSNNQEINLDIGNTSKINVEWSGKPETYQYMNNSGGGKSSNGIPFWLIVVCAIIIPPLGIALMFGITDKFWICLALTLLLWVPGMVYALIHVLK